MNLSENYGADYFEDEIDDEVINSAIDKHLNDYSDGEYTYSITYSTWGEDDLEIGDTDDKGFKVQDEPADEDDLRRIIRDYGFSYEDGTDWLVTLDLDTDYKTGKVTDYSMHIEKNGTPLTSEEYRQLTQPAVDDEIEDLGGDDLDDAGIYDDNKPIRKPMSITEANYNYTGFNRYPKMKSSDTEYPKYGRFNFEEIVDAYIETIADEYETEYMPSINYDSGSEEEIEAEESIQDEFRNKIAEAKKAAFNAVRHQVDEYEAELAKEIDAVFTRAFDLPTAVSESKLVKEEIFKPEMDLNPDVFPFTVGTKVNTPFGAGVVVGHDDADKSKRSTYPMSFPTKFSTYGVRPFVKLEDPSKIQPESVRKLYDQNGRLPFYRKELTKV